MRRTGSALALAVGLCAAGAARADTLIYGIPGWCEMRVVECSTEPDSTRRPPPRELSSVFMLDSWTIKAYFLAPDGRTNLVALEDGLRVVRGEQVMDIPLPVGLGMCRDVQWAPDSKRVAVWTNATPPGESHEHRALAVLDVTALSSPPTVVYWDRRDDWPWAAEWSPKGEALFVISSELDPAGEPVGGVVTRVDLATKQSAEVVRVEGELDFALPPRSRYAHGRGASDAAYRLVYGHAGGLFAVDPDGSRVRQVSATPATGAYLVEWSPVPGSDRVALFFKRTTKGEEQKLVGLHLAGLDDSLFEPLYEGSDVHTLWFSPKGTWISWATPRAISLRRVSGADRTVTTVTIPALPKGDPNEGEEPMIKGFAWDTAEERLAITAGNRLYIHELATKALREVARFGSTDDTFTADPRWVGDRVVLASYQDMNAIQGSVEARLEETAAGARFAFTGHAPRLPDGAVLHVSLRIRDAAAAATCLEAEVRRGRFSGEQTWPGKTFVPTDYETVVSISTESQSPAVCTFLLTHGISSSPTTRSLAVHRHGIGTDEQRAAFVRDTTERLLGFVGRLEALEVPVQARLQSPYDAPWAGEATTVASLRAIPEELAALKAGRVAWSSGPRSAALEQSAACLVLAVQRHRVGYDAGPEATRARELLAWVRSDLERLAKAEARPPK